jgi:hypothetical protein
MTLPHIFGVFAMATAPDQQSSEAIDPYPGGCQCSAYQWAFNIWMVLFLGVICAGFLNYLGIVLKTFYRNL